MKLTDWHYIVIRSIVILNYVKKSSQSKYKKKFCIYINLWSYSNFGNFMLLYSNTDIWKQSMQLYNLAKFSKRKNKYKIQFIKNEFPFHNLFWQVSTYDLPPKMTKTSTPSKMFWEPKSPPIVQGGEDTTTDNKALCTRC